MNLQQAVERMENVERAFVHVDFQKRDIDEHDVHAVALARLAELKQRKAAANAAAAAATAGAAGSSVVQMLPLPSAGSNP